MRLTGPAPRLGDQEHPHVASWGWTRRPQRNAASGVSASCPPPLSGLALRGASRRQSEGGVDVLPVPDLIKEQLAEVKDAT